MSGPPIPKDDNNYYHPSTEQEIIDLVKYARKNSYQVRVRGSGHSMPQAIFTDVCVRDVLDLNNPKAPEGDNVNIILDRYTAIISANGHIVTVEAGIHLGQDPLDPRSTQENSLLYQLHHTYGLALSDVGGISHQTVGGFLMTGSSGGSLKHDIGDNVLGLRFIDGNGESFEVSRLDKDQSNFYAALTSLGLLGVLSQVTFQCDKKFNIRGDQHGTSTDKASVDIFNDKPSGKNQMGLSTFLKETEYSRILWWPQSSSEGKDTVQVWQAKRIPDRKDFKPQPYVEFDNSQIMMLYSYLMTMTGSDKVNAVQAFADKTQGRFKTLRISELEKKGEISIEAEVFATIEQKVNKLVAHLITKFIGFIEDVGSKQDNHELRNFLTIEAVGLLNQIDKHKPFQDYAYCGLPMDNSADDILVPIMFTEIWMPLSRATEVTTAIHAYFNGKPEEDKITRTGNNAWELYAAKPSKAWLSMSYSDGTDVWKDGAFRIDPFWFLRNSGDCREMYRPIWKLLKDKAVPYRLHWAKIFPDMEDKDITAKFLVKDQYPKLSEFLALRKSKDPGGIFLNSYWRHWLGIRADSFTQLLSGY